MDYYKQKILKGGGDKLDLLASHLKNKYSTTDYHAIYDYVSSEKVILRISNQHKWIALGAQLVGANIFLQRKNSDIAYYINNGQWIDKIIVGGISFAHIASAIFFPLAVAGIVKQVYFFGDIEDDIVQAHSLIVT